MFCHSQYRSSVGNKRWQTWTFTVLWGSCTCSRVASTSRATTNPDVNRKGLSDSPAGSIMVAEALWICKQEENMMILKPGDAWVTKNMLAFLSPYLMGGHVGANQKKGPRPVVQTWKLITASSSDFLARLRLKGYNTGPDLLWKREVQEGTLPQHSL